MMRRWLSILAVVLLACLLTFPVAATDPSSDAGPGSTDPQADDQTTQPVIQPTQSVQVPTGSFVFGTPNGWTMDNSQNQDPIYVTLFGPDSGLRTQMAIFPQSTSLDDEVTSFKSSLAGLATGGIASEATQDQTIASEAAKVYTFSGTRQDGSSVSGQFTVLFHGGTEYAFITLANAATVPHMDDLNVLFGSMGFLT